MPLQYLYQQKDNSVDIKTRPHLRRRFVLLALPILLAIGVLLMARLEARPFDEGFVVVVGAGGAGQDPHEVAVVAQVLQQAGHPPKQSGAGGEHLFAWAIQQEGLGLPGDVFFFPLSLLTESSKISQIFCKQRLKTELKLGAPPSNPPQSPLLKLIMHPSHGHEIICTCEAGLQLCQVATHPCDRKALSPI